MRRHAVDVRDLRRLVVADLLQHCALLLKHRKLAVEGLQLRRCHVDGVRHLVEAAGDRFANGRGGWAGCVDVRVQPQRLVGDLGQSAGGLDIAGKCCLCLRLECRLRGCELLGRRAAAEVGESEPGHVFADAGGDIAELLGSADLLVHRVDLGVQRIDLLLVLGVECIGLRIDRVELLLQLRGQRRLNRAGGVDKALWVCRTADRVEHVADLQGGDALVAETRDLLRQAARGGLDALGKLALGAGGVVRRLRDVLLGVEQAIQLWCEGD